MTAVYPDDPTFENLNEGLWRFLESEQCHTDLVDRTKKTVLAHVQTLSQPLSWTNHSHEMLSNPYVHPPPSYPDTVPLMV